MKRIRAMGLGAAFWAGALGVAGAQYPGGINYAELFQELDSNGDRVIEKAEVPESAHSAFATLLEVGDTNKNGKIDQEEYRELLSSVRNEFEKSLPGTEERFKVMDRNGDGKLVRDEFQGPPMLFDRIDADKDGAITKSEAMSFRVGPGAAAGGGADRFKTMDKNGDGKLSQDEFQGPPVLFNRLDADGDGSVTQEEAAKFPNALNGGMFLERLKAMDEDGDGKVSKDEFTGPPVLFDQLDRNSDGFVSREDFPGLQGGPGGGAPGVGMDRFKAMDKNSDGKLSRGEFRGPPAMFDRLDKNHDGSLTEDEAMPFRAGLAPIAGGGGERFKAMDKNNDGKLSRQEWSGPPAMFDRFDADQDGSLTLDEIRAGFRSFTPGQRRPAAKEKAKDSGASEKSN